MLRRCRPEDFETIHSIINDAAMAYRGVIPPDCWKEPYMPREELAGEIAAGVVFWGAEQEGQLVGVMGIQHVGNVALIRHAYVRTACRRQGIGSKLLCHLLAQMDRPVLVGTWADATWAIRFYERHGFRLVTPQEKERLLGRYWTVPGRQMEASVVLADEKWFRSGAEC